MSIVTNAMVLNIQIGLWAGQRLDKEATRKVTTDAEADADAARVNKHLIPKESMKEITQTSGAVRTHLYAKTLPWKDNGDRLLTRIMFLPFIEEHERLVGEFDKAVDRFLDEEYPKARDAAEFRMGALFDPSDYPNSHELKRKFYINLDIDAVTEAGDFRVILDQQHADEVRSKMESAMNERLVKATTDVYSRLSEVVGHFARTMGEKDKVFRDTTMSNITDLVDLLPGLNVTGDPQLATLGDEIKQSLAGYDLKDLRKDPVIRSQAAKDADAIMAKMSGFMNAMQPVELRKAA